MTNNKTHDNDDSPENAVQDYLDWILIPASNLQKPSVNQESTKPLHPETRSISAALSKISNTSLTSPVPARQKRHGDFATPRPFADPAKPVRLMSTLPLAKQQSLDCSNQEQPIVVENAIAKEPERTKINTLTPDSVTLSPIEMTPQVETKNFSKKMTDENVSPQTQLSSAVATDQSTMLQQEKTIASVWLDNGRPSWAQNRFECLLFNVHGLTLAVPLVALGTIYPLQDELTPLFGQEDWFMGLMSVKDGNIRTVNTAKIVMPDSRMPIEDNTFSHVITLHGVDWGLAVSSISAAITLDPADVRWRTQRTQRPWLAGTVVEKMCALLDVSQLAAMFLDSDRAHY